MKRDFELIRQMLLRLEDEPSCEAELFARHFPEWQPETVNYHIWLLIQSGLIVGECNRPYPQKGFMCSCVCLTWQGQEFLASIRNDTAWQKIRTVLKEKSVDLSFEAVKAAAAMALKMVM